MKRSEKGFSAVEGLLILIIVGLIGFVGWYVYQQKNTKADKVVPNQPTQVNTENKSTAKDTAKINSNNTNDGYLVIKEWGIRIKPASSLPKLTYKIDNSDGHEWAKIVFVGTPANCEGFYHFNRAKAGQDIDGHNTTPEQYMNINPSIIQHVGEYYYVLGHGEAACDADSKVTDKQNELIQQITVGTNGSTYTIEAL